MLLFYKVVLYTGCFSGAAGVSFFKLTLLLRNLKDIKVSRHYTILEYRVFIEHPL
jgi:hypothetical protein